jgi:hypothetical protein
MKKGTVSAPFSIKYFIISKFYLYIAIIKGVSPSSSLTLTSAPYSTNNFTMSKSYWKTAIIKDV